MTQKTDWKAFTMIAAATAAAGVLSAFVFVAAVNPYGNLALSLPLEHHRVTGNERYAFPGLIRRKDYDSAVFGTSTVMLLHPHELNASMGGRFVNLSMGSATPWEQLQMMALFRRLHHPGQIVVAMDIVWCDPQKKADRLTFRPFPPWMYDDNPWNDYLHLLNDRALIHAARLSATWLGVARPAFGPDGYFRFVPDASAYDLAKAQANIYGNAAQRTPPITDLAALRATEQPYSDAPYPDLAELFAEIDRIPRDAQIVLMFAPYHASRFANEKSWPAWADCKQAAVRRAAERNNVTVIDFMRPSPLTLSDSNYWDPLHYTVAQASNIAQALGAAKGGRDAGELYRVLYRPGWRFDGRLP